jgi:hypothetical protein
MRLTGIEPVKNIFFGGFGMVLSGAKYSCLSGVAILIFIGFVAKTVDIMSNTC